ncbi:hypothetical protein LY78DRAFT_592517 [Colletotrichum sublineola]|uniref:Uncharacterized protein n=1 Tax=Colletotrichum sublineola TaxID=1173701 RepID=A0A066XAW4_COLSU|nr:hypothetical protein LY78DRAFT_592517 [Colletotrichum sublineola]KDN66313.1 hypothetical protein CSUB01_08851 [Colletotrichum sublineola]
MSAHMSLDVDKDMSWEPESPDEEGNGNASDLGWFIKDCVLANNKWLEDQSFIWNGTLRFDTSHPDASIDPDSAEREAQHGHMELEYPGPMPDGRGVSVAAYTRTYLNGDKYGVINTAFNALDQEHAFTVYFVVGPPEQEDAGAAPRAFDVEAVRLYLQRTGFFDARHRDQSLGPLRRRHPRFFHNQRPIFLVDDPTAEGRDRVLPVKFVVGAADRDVTVADLRMWFCLTGFFDQETRNREIAAELECVGERHAQRGVDDTGVQEYLASLDPGNAFR